VAERDSGEGCAEGQYGLRRRKRRTLFACPEVWREERRGEERVLLGAIAA